MEAVCFTRYGVAMYTYKRKENVTYLIEWRLCASCMRMFCASTESHVILAFKGMVFHSHITCPPLKQKLPLLKGEWHALTTCRSHQAKWWHWPSILSKCILLEVSKTNRLLWRCTCVQNTKHYPKLRQGVLGSCVPIEKDPTNHGVLLYLPLNHRLMA